MPKRSWVDPLKDMLAIEKEVALNLTTQTDEAMARGRDYEEILDTKVREMDMLKEKGLWVEPETADENSPTQDMAEVRGFMEEMREEISMIRNSTEQK